MAQTAFLLFTVTLTFLAFPAEGDVYPSYNGIWWRQPVCLLATPGLHPCPACAEPRERSPGDSRDSPRLIVASNVQGKDSRTLLLVSPKIAEVLPAEDVRLAPSTSRNKWTVDPEEEVRFWDIPVIAVLVARRCVPCYQIPRCASRPEFQKDFDSQFDNKPTLSINVEPYPLTRVKRKPDPELDGEEDAAEGAEASSGKQSEEPSADSVAACLDKPNAAYVRSVSPSGRGLRQGNNGTWDNEGEVNGRLGSGRDHSIGHSLHGILNASIQHFVNGASIFLHGKLKPIVLFPIPSTVPTTTTTTTTPTPPTWKPRPCRIIPCPAVPSFTTASPTATTSTATTPLVKELPVPATRSTPTGEFTTASVNEIPTNLKAEPLMRYSPSQIVCPPLSVYVLEQIRLLTQINEETESDRSNPETRAETY